MVPSEARRAQPMVACQFRVRRRGRLGRGRREQRRNRLVLRRDGYRAFTRRLESRGGAAKGRRSRPGIPLQWACQSARLGARRLWWIAIDEWLRPARRVGRHDAMGRCDRRDGGGVHPVLWRRYWQCRAEGNSRRNARLSRRSDYRRAAFDADPKLMDGMGADRLDDFGYTKFRLFHGVVDWSDRRLPHLRAEL